MVGVYVLVQVCPEVVRVLVPGKRIPIIEIVVVLVVVAGFE
jgi:hypothetical protein